MPLHRMMCVPKLFMALMLCIVDDATVLKAASLMNHRGLTLQHPVGRGIVMDDAVSLEECISDLVWLGKMKRLGSPAKCRTAHVCDACGSGVSQACQVATGLRCSKQGFAAFNQSKRIDLHSDRSLTSEATDRELYMTAAREI